jgi:hypothetical protein
LLRFHPHPSHRRSIGQTIGLTAYRRSEQPYSCRLFPEPLRRFLRVGARIRVFRHPTHIWSLLAHVGVYDSNNERAREFESHPRRVDSGISPLVCTFDKN